MTRPAALLALGLIAATAWLGRGLVARFRIANRSMLPTLLPGDRLLVNLHVGGRLPPQRFDLVVFQHPEHPNLLAIKRLVGLPSELIALRDGQLFVNGSARREPYVRGQSDRPIESWQLGPDQYLVLGDDRAESRDSRHFGPLASAALVGTAWYRYWPPHRRGRLRRIH